MKDQSTNQTPMEAPDEITPSHTTPGPNSKTGPRIAWRQINIPVMGLEKIDKLPKKEGYDSNKSLVEHINMENNIQSTSISNNVKTTSYNLGRQNIPIKTTSSLQINPQQSRQSSNQTTSQSIPIINQMKSSPIKNLSQEKEKWDTLTKKE
jgi:hypothetical protein